MILCNTCTHYRYIKKIISLQYKYKILYTQKKFMCELVCYVFVVALSIFLYFFLLHILDFFFFFLASLSALSSRDKMFFLLLLIVFTGYWLVQQFLWVYFFSWVNVCQYCSCSCLFLKLCIIFISVFLFIFSFYFCLNFQQLQQVFQQVLPVFRA